MQDPLLDMQNEPNSFWGKLYFNYIHNIYHLLCRNKEMAIPFIKNIVQLWDNSTELKSVEPIKYLSAVSNYLTNLMFLNERESFIAYFESFTPPTLTSITQEAIYFEHLWLMRNSYFDLKRDYNGMVEFTTASQADIKKYMPYINKVRLLIMRFTTAFSNTIVGAYGDSNDMLQLIFDSKEVELRKDVQAVSRMLYTINHFEQNNLLLFKHVINTSKHFLRNNDFYYETESVFMKYMTKLSKIIDKKDKAETFQKMKTELLTIIQTNENEHSACNQIHLIEWIDAKILRIPFIEALQAQVNK
jgi:hypothetical protein